MHKIDEIFGQRKYFFLLLIISPIFWWIILQPIKGISEFVKLPIYTKNKIQTIFSEEKLRSIDEMRWNAFGEEKEETISKLYYNKGLIIIDNLFEYLSLLSPRIYFQSGDGSNFSPPGVEPIPFFAFFFWLFGLIKLIKQRSNKLLFLFLSSPVFAFFAGSRSVIFLIPTLIIYIYIAAIGMEALVEKYKYKNLIITLLIIYGVYILSRALWLIS